MYYTFWPLHLICQLFARGYINNFVGCFNLFTFLSSVLFQRALYIYFLNNVIIESKSSHIYVFLELRHHQVKKFTYHVFLDLPHRRVKKFAYELMLCLLKLVKKFTCHVFLELHHHRVKKSTYHVFLELRDHRVKKFTYHVSLELCHRVKKLHAMYFSSYIIIESKSSHMNLCYAF